ncbi:sulfotransferase family protein [Rasiella sp. SM2506]|uniref:sulfotransferase family protein n=1 Tax=Rasiella sp. SM2506 TaxID=3423914 RepID=UPI003D7B2257
MTSESRKVNLFVLGAMRAGTTSFMEFIGKHPAIYTSPIKEPHFFTESLPKEIFEALPTNHLKHYFKKEFPKPIHRAHVTAIEEYQKLFKNATNQKYLAEGSVSYLHAPHVASELQHYNPEAKIIIVTRDPLERAVSHYHMNVGLFREKRSFEAALQSEIEAYHKNELPWYSYLNMSFYKATISNYRQHFGDTILVISLEDLVENTEKTSTQVSTFLEICPFETQALPALNKNKRLRFKKVFGVLHYLKLKEILFSIVPSTRKSSVKNIFLSDCENEVKMSTELRKTLLAIFQKEC